MALQGIKLKSYEEIQELRKQVFKVGDKVVLTQYPNTNYACALDATVVTVLHPMYEIDIDHHDSTSILKQRLVKAPVHFLRPREESNGVHAGTDNQPAEKPVSIPVSDHPIFKGGNSSFE